MHSTTVTHSKTIVFNLWLIHLHFISMAAMFTYFANQLYGQKDATQVWSDQIIVIIELTE